MTINGILDKYTGDIDGYYVIVDHPYKKDDGLKSPWYNINLNSPRSFGDCIVQNWYIQDGTFIFHVSFHELALAEAYDKGTESV